MSGVHDAARVGFDTAADAYERGRPGFPQEAVEYLVQELRMEAGSTVVDLAAGTGKLTRLLAPSGARVIAVEPVEGMRRTFVRVVPAVPLVGGLAERMPLRDGSVDAVTVAQAFHWFDAEAAIVELHRVLARDGRLALARNVRDEQASPLAAGLTAWFERYRRGVPAFRDRAWERAFAETELFTSLRTRTFLHEQRLTVDGFVDRAMSVSFIAALPQDRRGALRDELIALLPARASEVGLPYRCEISVYERI